MLVGSAAGVIAGIAAILLIKAPVRPDVAIALVLCLPSVLGLGLVLFSGRRWVTALGAFVLSAGPGWFTVLVLIEVTHGA
jgi:hypothetical protein